MYTDKHINYIFMKCEHLMQLKHFFRIDQRIKSENIFED